MKKLVLAMFMILFLGCSVKTEKNITPRFTHKNIPLYPGSVVLIEDTGTKGYQGVIESIGWSDDLSSIRITIVLTAIDGKVVFLNSTYTFYVSDHSFKIFD